MKIYKLFVRPESGDGCAVLEVQGAMFRSSWISPEMTAELEKNPQAIKALDYPPENEVSPEFLRGFKTLVTVFTGEGSPD